RVPAGRHHARRGDRPIQSAAGLVAAAQRHEPDRRVHRHRDLGDHHLPPGDEVGRGGAADVRSPCGTTSAEGERALHYIWEDGTCTTSPSISSVTLIWQDRREYSVTSSAPSTMSFSFCSGCGRRSFHSGAT